MGVPQASAFPLPYSSHKKLAQCGFVQHGKPPLWTDVCVTGNARPCLSITSETNLIYEEPNINQQ